MHALNTVISHHLLAWLQKQGVAPTGVPVVRYLIIDMAALRAIAVGIPIARVLSGDDRISTAMLRANQYASLVYTGWDIGISPHCRGRSAPNVLSEELRARDRLDDPSAPNGYSVHQG